MGRSMIKKDYPGFMDVGLNLPVLVGDEDFIEHLHEGGFTDTIELDDLIFEWIDWAKENVDEH
jgi:hypothetical protein